MHILVIFLFFQGGEIVELNQYFIHGVVFQKSRKEVSTGLLPFRKYLRRLTPILIKITETHRAEIVSP
jgi:hypothetical protein